MQRAGGAPGWAPGQPAGGPGEPPHFADDPQGPGDQAADAEGDEASLEGEEDPVKVWALPPPPPPPPPAAQPQRACQLACARVPARPAALPTPSLPQVVVRIRPPLPRELHGFRPFENAVLVDPAHQLITLSENLAALSNGGVENGIVSGQCKLDTGQGVASSAVVLHG